MTILGLTVETNKHQHQHQHGDKKMNDLQIQQMNAMITMLGAAITDLEMISDIAKPVVTEVERKVDNDLVSDRSEMNLFRLASGLDGSCENANAWLKEYRNKLVDLRATEYGNRQRKNS